MSAPLQYSGPGQVAQSIGSGPVVYIYQAEGENGQVKLEVNQKRTRRSTAIHGYLKSTLEDETARISLTPFDSWAILPALFPAYLGITTAGTNGTAGVLAIGTRPHDIAAGAANGTAPTTIWTPDGRLYRVVRTAITKPPGMRLGVGQPLFTGMEITGLADPAMTLGQGGELLDTAAHVAGTGTATGITESGASNPAAGGTFPAYGVPDFVNGYWSGAWGAVAGFTTLDAEDGWSLEIDAKYSPLISQKRTYHYKLDSIEFMVKARLTGPTHTQLAAKALAFAAGAVLTQGSATDLILTGPSSKTVTLKDCTVYLEGQGFEFGGTKLATGEVAFVTKLDFTSSATPNPGLVFSA